MYFIGVTSIYILVSLSMERYYIINSQVKNRFISKKTVLRLVAFCVLKGLFWSSLPLFGWSYYSLEGAMTSCSVEWKERSINVVSYNVCMFLFVYLLPLIIIWVSNVKLIMMVCYVLLLIEIIWFKKVFFFVFWQVMRLQRLLRKSEKFSYFEKKTLFEMKATIVMIIIISKNVFLITNRYKVNVLYSVIKMETQSLDIEKK